ncbi:MAG: zinc ribbon domain-containing protein [Oscillospiraceae bacterium]|nr:zinc ribbon domain-containing protein [Oscillospiraceae bacterium]
MFCKHCGSQVDDNSKFCPVCGKSLASDISQGNGKIQMHWVLIFVAIGLGLHRLQFMTLPKSTLRKQIIRRRYTQKEFLKCTKYCLSS